MRPHKLEESFVRGKILPIALAPSDASCRATGWSKRSQAYPCARSFRCELTRSNRDDHTRVQPRPRLRSETTNKLWQESNRLRIALFPSPIMSDVTNILSQIESGDPSAVEQLLPLVYEELRKLAAAGMAREKPGQTLQATAPVHDAYLRLVDVEQA